MGIVYEAWDTRLERRVALKMVHPHLLADPAICDRFEKEAKRAARIEHPNVVRVYRVDTLDGRVAIEMQYIDGTPLNVLLRSGPISPRDAADLLRQLLDALIACHEQGVVHCDLKPGNLLVSRDGHVMLTDFGIARALFESATQDTSWQSTSGGMTGPIWGTPLYCPPEAWEGESITTQWDLYAAGALIYEAIAGAPPFHGQTPAALMRAVLTTSPQPLNEVRPETSSAFAELIGSLMAREPSARPNSARAALEHLQKTLEFDGSGIDTQRFELKFQSDSKVTEAHRTANTRITRGWTRRYGVLTPFVLILAILAAAPVAHYVWKQGRYVDPVLVTSDPKAGELLVIKNTAFFVADDGVHGRELWRSVPGSPNTCELVADIVKGQGSSDPHHFKGCEAGGFVFTATSTEAGSELWYCDDREGNANPVRMLKDVNPGPSGSDPQAIASHDNTVLFAATTPGAGHELWRATIGNEDQTQLVLDFFPGVESSIDKNPAIYVDADGIYMIAHADRVRGRVLCRYRHNDGLLQELTDVGEHTGSIIKAGRRIYMANKDDAHGYELWSYDETSSAFGLVKDIWPGSHSSSPSEFFGIGTRIFFQASSPEGGKELYEANAEKTSFKSDINPGSDSDGDPSGFVLVGMNLLFRAKDNKNGRELWAIPLDGGGTTCVRDIMPGPDSSEPYNLVAGPSYFLFTANDGAHGEELWTARWADGKWETRMIEDLYKGPVGAEPHALQWTQDNHAFFIAKTPDAGETLCALIPGPDLEGIELEGAEPTRVDIFRLREVEKS